tara:strand:+ start:89 stop:376 length:288 start_codon:yes stop_codon:yes gene_type:complete
MNNKFVVKFLIDFWNNEDGLYTVDEIIESKNIDELTDKLDNDIEEFTPEQSIPNWHDLGDFNIEYVQIKNEKGEEVYKDNDFSDDLKKIGKDKKF